MNNKPARGGERKGSNMRKFILLAESGADVPPELAKRYQIKIVPMHVSFGDNIKDDMSFGPEELFAFYSKTGILPKTSGCNPDDFIKVFDEIHQTFPDSHIIHLAYSAVTTCSYQSALIAAQDRDYITSIDTKSVSAGQSMVVLGVARFIEENEDCTLEDVIKEADNLISRVHMGFFPGDLDYLRAGGRVSNAAYLGAKILGIKPLIEINDGRLMAAKKYRGKMLSVAQKFLREYAENHNLEKERVALIYAAGLDEHIMETAFTIAQDIGFREILWIQTGCVVSSHSGPGGFGIAGFSKK